MSQPELNDFEKWIAETEKEQGWQFPPHDVDWLRRAWTAATAVAVERIRDVIRNPVRLCHHR